MTSPRPQIDRMRTARRQRRRQRFFHPAVEPLEPRVLLSIFTVTNTSDTGSGSLRSAMLQANASPGADVIEFSIGSGPQTITPTTPLPALTGPLVIDGATQPGFAATPLIELRGNNLSAPALQLLGGDSAVRGLVVNKFFNNAIELASSRNVVEGCWIGLDPSGAQAAENFYFGILVTGADNRIGGLTPAARNVISGNYLGGVRIAGSAATGNVVQGNRIGTDITGMLSVRNVGGFNTGAIKIENAPGNVIGGREAGAGNLISGNGSWALEIYGSAATGNVVEGNVIGLDITGQAKLSNGGGVRIDGAPSNTIGGNAAAARNVVSASGSGVYIVGAASEKNRVQGNFIGVDVTGTRTDPDDDPANGNGLGNQYGVYITEAPANQIVNNVISGNSAYGLGIFGAGASGNVVQGNLVGTDVTGTVALGNSSGMTVQAPQTLIGGTLPGTGNVIADNKSSGIWIYGGNATGNRLQGNLIGTAIDGTTALGNRDAGVFIFDAGNNEVGGKVREAANVISANGSYGISISGSTSSGNRVQGNLIGTDRDGAAALGNGAAGVILSSGASNNLIGGTDAGAENVISANRGEGVLLAAPSPGNKVQNNRIGTDRSGMIALGNAGHGVAIATSDSQIGGTEPLAGNLIANNGGSGVSISQGSGNSIVANAIHANSGLGIDLYPFAGVTANDVGDGDTGANRLQNYPDLTQVTPAGSRVHVTGRLSSTASTDFRLDFYASPAADVTGFGEGARYLGRVSVRTNAAGEAPFLVTLNGLVPPGQVVTATATDATGNTSEFSRAVGLTWKSDLEDFLQPQQPFQAPSDTNQPGSPAAVVADTPELRDLEYLARHVPFSDLAALGHIDTPLLILYSRWLQGITTPVEQQTLNNTPYGNVYSTDGVRPHVQAHVANVPVTRSLLEALGLVVTSVRDTEAWKIVAGFLPVSAIGEVARIAALGTLQASERGKSDAQGSVFSQAEASSFAEQLQRVLITVDGNEGSIDGRIDIGVISDSMNQLAGGLAAGQASGDLPAGNRLRILDDGTSSDDDEGRAMAELIYDIGPAFDILFHSRNNSPGDMAEAFEHLQEEGADIITDDISWYSEPVFQDGVVADTIQELYRDHGTLMFGSAGNRNNETYVGTWRDDDDDDLHEFAGGDETLNFELGDTETLDVYLHWNEPWGHSGVDIDLELYDATLSEKVADSDQDNNPLFNIFGESALPLEVLTFTNNTGARQNYHLAFRFDDGDSPAGISLYFIAMDGSDDLSEPYVLNNPGIAGNHAAPNIFSMAAVPYWNTNVAETFSSHGPNEIHFSTNGNRLDEPEIRQKPDFTAIDNVDTTFFGTDSDGNLLPNFSGTSAASPNAAAIAGLVIDAADRVLSYNELTTIFRKTATGPTVGAWDSTFGEGVINALGAGLMARGMQPAEVYLELNPFGDLTSSDYALNADFDTDRFVFACDVDGDATIAVANDVAAMDPGAILWNVEQAELVDIDYNSGGDGDDAQLAIRSTSGTLHQLEVFTEATIGGAGANAGYTLSIDGPAPFAWPVALNDDSDGTAGEVIVTGDADYFELRSPEFAGRRMTIIVTSVAQLDAVVSLYDDQGQLLQRVQDAAAGAQETLVFEDVEPDATYYIRVGALNYATSGRFEVSVDFETALPAEMTEADGFVYFHHDGQSDDGQTFSLVDADANIDHAQDVDNFYVGVDQPGDYLFGAWRESGDVVPHLQVYDAVTGQPLPTHYWDRLANYESLTATLVAQHRYIVAVSDRHRDGSGDVALYVSGPAAPEVLEVAIDAGGQGTRQNLELAVQEDMDFFHFVAPSDADGTLTVTVSPGIGLDAAAVLFDATGQELSKAYLNGLQETETISLDAISAGADYYLTVLSKDYASHGHYDVTVDFGVVRGTVRGLKYLDENQNGQRDAGESGLGGWVMYIDEDQDGALDLAGHVEPDDSEDGELLNRISPAVTLYAEGAGVTTDQVTARISGLASTGFEVFSNDWQQDPLWSEDEAELYGEFLVPVAAVSLDFVADNADDVGRLEVYDLDGHRLGISSVQPGAGQSQAMTVAFNGARIASFRAFAVDSAGRLDRLAFGGGGQEPFDVTDIGGHYEIRELALASYDVREVLRAGWTQMAPAAGAHPVQLTLAAPIARDLDFANFAPPQLTGTVWHDVNGDRVRQPSETGLEGWAIYLEANGNGQYDAHETATLSGADGRYAFAGLPEGNYTVSQVLPLHTGRTVPAAPGTYVVQLADDQLVADLDFGTYFDSTIVGRVFEDLDRDGQRDQEDTGLDGWTVFVDLNGDGTAAGDPSDVTEFGGSYIIEGVPPGTWPVRVSGQIGWSLTAPAAGFHELTVASDSRHMDIEFGYAQRFDFGDAPAPYPSLFAANGARHRFDPQLRLGTQWDAEPDGLPTAAADGDDRTQQDDEDGVVFLTALEPGRATQVQLLASGNGMLDAWVDFNADGDWNDAGERIFNGQVVVAGAQVLEFLVPGVAVPGVTHARFRLSSSGVAAATGAATDGEVEDYRIEIDNPFNLPLIVPPLEDYGPMNQFGDRHVTFTLDSPTDRATWRFTTKSGGPAVFTATADPSSGLHPLLALYDGRGALVAVGGGNPDPSNDALSYTLIPGVDEVYTLLVQDAELDTAGVVQSSFFDTPTMSSIDAIETDAAGLGGAGGVLITMTIPPLADVDYYQLAAIGGGTPDPSNRLSVKVSPVESYRLEFQLFDGSGNPVGDRVLSPVNGQPAEHTYTGLAGGQSYVVAVFPHRFEDHPAGGDYRIDVDFDTFDFGDAPATYATLRADQGPSHLIAPSFYLGSGVDNDGDGRPTAAADGDDGAGSDDEDGVVFTQSLSPGHPAEIQVTVSDAGKLDAWIDFGGDGDFSDSSDHVLTGEPLVAGVNTLAIRVPVGAAAGATYARFRLSSAGALSFDGPAADGEVEDYAVVIEASGEIHGTLWHDINTDGHRDANEPPLAGWTAFLDLDHDQVVDDNEATAVTDDNGHYAFADVAPGTYEVRQLLNPGWHIEFPKQVPDWTYIAATYLECVGGFIPCWRRIEDTIDIYSLSPLPGELLDSIELPDFVEGVVNDVEIGPGGDLYVALDTGEGGEILQLNFVGARLRSIPVPLDPVDGESGIDYPYPNGFDVLPDGRLLVAQPNSHQIVLLDPDGSLIETFSLPLFHPIDVGMLSDGSLTFSDADSADSLLNVRYDDKIWFGSFPTSLRDAAGDVFASVNLPSFEALETYDDHVWGVWNNDLWKAIPREDEGYDVEYFHLRNEGHSLAVANNEVPFGVPIRDFLVQGDGDGEPTPPTPPTVVGTGRGSWQVTVAPGALVTSVDFARVAYASVRGSKFFDIDGDGVRDTKEPGVAGATVWVDVDGDGVHDGREPSATTDAKGQYSIDNVLPGTFAVREAAGSTWVQTYPVTSTYPITVTPGSLYVGYDFGDAAATWQNPAQTLDTNADQDISPLDALLIINYLNEVGTGPLPPPVLPHTSPPQFLDTSGDGYVFPLDALLVINELNRGSDGEGETSAAGGAVPAARDVEDTSEGMVPTYASQPLRRAGTSNRTTVVPPPALQILPPQPGEASTSLGIEVDERTDTMVSGISEDLESILDAIVEDILSSGVERRSP